MQQIEQLQDGVTAFLLQFYPDASRPDEQLVQLRLDKDAYLRLREKEERLAKERQEQQVQIDALTAEIRAILSRYGLADSAQALSQAVRALRERASQYAHVQERAHQLDAERQDAERQAQAHTDELAAFFETYRLSGKSEEQLLAQAEDDSRAFAAAMTAFKYGCASGKGGADAAGAGRAGGASPTAPAETRCPSARGRAYLGDIR